MRRLLLVIALVACKSKSEPAAEQSRPAEPSPVGGAPASGSAGAGNHAGSGSANIATPVTGMESGAIQPVKGGEPRNKDTPTADPAPAVPTPAKPDDGVKPAGVATGEAPSAGGLSAELGKVPSGIQGGRDPGARLPPGRVGFAGIQSSALTTQAVTDASAKIKTAYRAGLERCYRVHLSTHPNATGKATLMLTLAPTGVPTPAVTGFADDLSACLSKIAEQWRFLIPPDARPIGDGPMRLTIELTFNPG